METQESRIPQSIQARTFLIHSDNELKKQQNDYLNDNQLFSKDQQNIENSIHYSEQEIMINGVVSRWEIHQDENTLKMKYRCINHSVEELDFHPLDIELKTAQTIIKPTLQIEKDTLIQLKKGERKSIQLTYELSDDKLKSFYIKNNFLIISDKQLPIFAHDIPFEKYELGI
ncbi:hypothetical protein [Sediminitomix flava]|uniref:Uncharacterized protein n=1 Tax=Sediminitomix flava TaxID=379075 RepID=A0A315Z9F9_SEDFL|nr:hypothetical protein [Sediminitomix flava]PWJ41059.1 hypothetical protein BC781_104334 [Sediminitomix flava]